MKIKTSELTGTALDWAVWLADHGEPSYPCKTYKHIYMGNGEYWAPSTNWAQGGPLIEKYNIAFRVRAYEIDAIFDAYSAFYTTSAKNHLIAACRAIVAAKLGEEVDIPEELLK